MLMNNSNLHSHAFRHSKKLLLFFIVLFASGGAIATCTQKLTTQPSSEVELTQPGSSALQTNRDIPALTDNLATFSSPTPEGSLIIDLIGKAIKPALQSDDTTLLDRYLAPDYELRFARSKDKFQLVNRFEFLQALDRMKAADKRQRTIDYTVQAVTQGRDNNAVVISLISTYRFRHFNPRFVEGLLFERMNGGWVLSRHAVAPLHPSEGMYYNVNIIVSKISPSDARSKLATLSQTFLFGDPDRVIDDFEGVEAGKTIVGDEREYTVLFIFREPPPAGAKITIEHQFDRPNFKMLEPYRFDYGVEEASPFYAIANGTHASYQCSGGSFCNGGTITYRVFAHGQKVADRTVMIERR